MEDAGAEHPFVTVLQHRLLQGTRKLKRGRSDDWADRMNHMYTSLFLAAIAFLITFSQLTGDRIRCWLPAEFTLSYEEYVHHYCWVQNTYFYPITDYIPENIEKHQAAEITYYQWVAMILFLQAIMFKIPNIIWEVCHSYSGIKLGQMVSIIDHTHHNSMIERKQVVENIGSLLVNWLNKQKATGIRKKLARLCIFCCYRRAGTFLTGLFISIKLLYLITAVGQFFLLNAFMAWDFVDLGAAWIQMMRSGQPMRESHRFPRETLCDFKIRILENVQDWTVQCVLPINLFNEKAFIIIWFWLIIMMAVNAYTTWKWLYLILWKENEQQYVWKHIKILHGRTAKVKRLCRDFARDFLRKDGCFVIRIIGMNTNEVVAIDLLDYLFQHFERTRFGEESHLGKSENEKPFPNDNTPKANGNIPQCDIRRTSLLLGDFFDRRVVHFGDYNKTDGKNLPNGGPYEPRTWDFLNFRGQGTNNNELPNTGTMIIHGSRDLLHFDEPNNNIPSVCQNNLNLNGKVKVTSKGARENGGIRFTNNFGPRNSSDTNTEFESTV